MADEATKQEAHRFWVIKLGGSLLGLPDLAERLRSVIAQVPAKPLLIVGGGETADIVRQWDDRHQLSDASAHWLAIRAMDLNLGLLETLLPESACVASYEAATQAWETNQLPLLKCFDWLETDEASTQTALPHNWDVTSDSIAGWAAIRWQAAGLLFLKSVDCPQTPDDWKSAADAFFPHLAPKIPAIAWCNLRREDWRISVWDSARDRPMPVTGRRGPAGG